MARSRNLKPGFFLSDVLADVQPLGRLLFAGLWTIADREGRLEDRPKKIKAEVLPYDSCNVDELLSDLDARGFIRRYSAKGTSCIQIVTWAKHQNPHLKEAPSTIPAPDLNSSSPDISRTSTVPAPFSNGASLESFGTSPEGCGLLVVGSLDLVPDSRETPSPPSGDRFDDFWSGWPKSERKQDKKQCREYWKLHKLDLLADEILADIEIKKQTEKWRGGFVEGPLVYLRGNRWEDGVTPGDASSVFDYEAMARGIELEDGRAAREPRH